jgi:hypothetical protein
MRNKTMIALDDLSQFRRGGDCAPIAARSCPDWLSPSVAVAGFASRWGRFFAAGTDFRHFATIVRVPWIPRLGINYHLAADGISLTMRLVTGLTAVSRGAFLLEVESGLTNSSSGSSWSLPVPTACFSARSVSPLRFLRAGHHSKIFPDRDLGFDEQGIRRDEADALLLSSAARSLFIGIIAIYRYAGGHASTFSSSPVPLQRAAPNVGFPQSCFSASPCWPVSGRFTLGRRPATSPRQRRLDVARRHRHETGGLRRTACGV